MRLVRQCQVLSLYSVILREGGLKDDSFYALLWCWPEFNLFLFLVKDEETGKSWPLRLAIWLVKLPEEIMTFVPGYKTGQTGSYWASLYVIGRGGKVKIMSFVPGYEAGQTASYWASLYTASYWASLYIFGREVKDYDLCTWPWGWSNCQLLSLSSFWWYRKKRSRRSWPLYLAMRLVKLPTTGSLFLLVVQEEEE
jgi:hypothetical protein